MSIADKDGYVLRATSIRKNTANVSESTETPDSIAWLKFTDEMPGAGQPILAYRKTKNPQTMFHTLLYWIGDEFDYTHWCALERPKQ